MRERILVVDDESGPREGLCRLLEAWGYPTVGAASGEEALEKLRLDGRISAIITDLVMPGLDGLELLRSVQQGHPIPVIVLTGHGTIEQAVQAIRLGAQDILEKPVEPDRLKILLEKLAGAWALLAENRQLRAELRERGALGPLRGVSAAMREVFRQIEQVAPSTLSVLIVGESGTGKELVAQTLHQLSPRRRNEFVPVNCAAIPPTLLESEIFGHEKGAFTGAFQRKIGCFEMASHGTLFLDEIAEMEESVQAKLLRVLQEQKFRRLGGQTLIEADVRIIAATNRDPKRAIADGKLREDLYYRLNVFTIQLPPLRERPEDIPLLARHFAEQYAARHGTPVPALDSSTMECLLRYAWPGNVRELKNAIERASLLSGGAAILPEHLPPEVSAAHAGAALARGAGPEADGTRSAGQTARAILLRVGCTMRQAEREILRTTLEHTGGNKTQAARILGISLKTMHNKVKKYRL